MTGEEQKNSEKIPCDNTFVNFGFNSLTDLGFIAIDKGAIEMTIANINSVFHSLRYLAWWRL